MSSAEEIGRLLRDAREERGLDLLAVHDQLSRPITQLEALEQGDLSRLPDQALALSTLRRYAVFLGLDGDALALRMIDAWSARPPTGPSPNDTAGVTNVVAAVTTGPDHLRAFTQTGQVPRVGAGSTAAPGGYGFGVAPGPPTGTFPVVPHQEIKDSKRAVARARRRMRAPTPLKVLTWLAALLMVAVIAGLAIYQLRPEWLAKSHILRVSAPTSLASGSSGSSNTPGSSNTSGTSGTQAPTAPTAGAGSNNHGSPVVTTTNTVTSANYCGQRQEVHHLHRHLRSLLDTGDRLELAVSPGGRRPAGRETARLHCRQGNGADRAGGVVGRGGERLHQEQSGLLRRPPGHAVHLRVLADLDLTGAGSASSGRH